MEQNNPTQPGDKLEENQQKISGIWDNVKAFLNELLDIREDSDRSETVESVRKDISFQGHNAWILIFSIMVASIGLNVGSTAVVIGAMLISPLMGPIVGMGLGTAINDEKMLRRSLINLIVMMVLSLITATIYFKISPFVEFNDELKNRTFPTFLDVLIAIFGGLALIVAKSKKGTMSNAIAGVAIATALMPPLCTAGYGIAMWDISIFGGAIYLFSINAVFIALSTFVVCKLLNFPMVKYANQAKRKRISRIATAVGIIVLLPSVFFFYQLYQDQLNKQARLEFVESLNYKGSIFTPIWNEEKKELIMSVVGKEVPEEKIKEWEDKFYQMEDLEECTVTFVQGSRTIIDSQNEDLAKIQEERIEDFKLIRDKDSRIEALENQLRLVSNKFKDKDILLDELGYLYPQIGSMGLAMNHTRDYATKKMDSTEVITISFKDSLLDEENKKVIKENIYNWLKYRLKSERVQVNEVKYQAMDSLSQ